MCSVDSSMARTKHTRLLKFIVFAAGPNFLTFLGLTVHWRGEGIQGEDEMDRCGFYCLSAVSIAGSLIMCLIAHVGVDRGKLLSIKLQ